VAKNILSASEDAPTRSLAHGHVARVLGRRASIIWRKSGAWYGVLSSLSPGT
jgi:hypothetical protein